MHHQMVAALQHPGIYADKVKGAIEIPKMLIQCAFSNAVATFTNDNLRLGSNPHNHSLFVTGYISEQKVKRTLMDRGSAANIMPKSMMHDLHITVVEFSKSWMMIQGLNLEGQRATGMIYVKLSMDGLSMSSIFHVIDAKTS